MNTNFQMDALLQEKLNDIDELIRSELEYEPYSPIILSLQSLDFLNDPAFSPEKIGTIFKSPHILPNKVNEVEMEVQILDLKDVYDKKTLGKFQGLEYRLEDSEVTVVLQASDEISSVRAFVQRCPEAAIRTHDTIGPVELDINTLQCSVLRRVVSIDLASVYKTKDGDLVYWLEKADVMQRNKWELIIVLAFSSGLSGSVTSKPFRVTTTAGYKAKDKGDIDSGCSNVQRLVRKITSPYGRSVNDDDDWERFRTLSSPGHKEKDGAYALNEEFKGFNLFVNDDHQPLFEAKSEPFTKGKVSFQPDFLLDKRMVIRYYDRMERIHHVDEQPDLPGLLKLVGSDIDSNLADSPRRRSTGHKSSDNDLWWACGRCFFERRKKSTIKAHVIQQVCQKTAEIKKSRSNISKKKRQRHASWDFGNESFKSYSWKASLSV